MSEEEEALEESPEDQEDDESLGQTASVESNSTNKAESFSTQVKGRWDMENLLDEADGLLGYHTPDWSRPTVEAASFIVSESGAPEMFPVGPNLSCIDESVLAGILAQFSSMSLDRIHHFALNGEFMYALFRDKKLVDILIHVEDKIFYGHRNILCTHSTYFAAILVDNDVPPYKVTDITINAVDSSLFQLFLHFAYTGDLFVTPQNLLNLKHLANALQSSTLKARLILFMSKMSLMTLPEALDILCNHMIVDETPLAVEVVKLNFKDIFDDVESFGMISLDDFKDIISASNVCVNSELDVFWAVLFWVAYDSANRVNHLNSLMKEVRFTNMSSLELLDCARVSELVRMSKVCKTLLITANWVCHARELGLEDPLGLPFQPKRQCLNNQPTHEPTVAEFDYRFLIYTTLMERHGTKYYQNDEKHGVSFDNLDEISKFVYPRDDSMNETAIVGKPQTTDEAASNAGPGQHSKPNSKGAKNTIRATDRTSEVPGTPAPKTKSPKSSYRSRLANVFTRKSDKSKRAAEETSKSKTSSTSLNSEINDSDTKRESIDNEAEKDESEPAIDEGPTEIDSNETDKKTSNGESASDVNESQNKDMSLNAPVLSGDHSRLQSPVDPLLLWESSLLPSTQVALSGGPIMQPMRLQKQILRRAPTLDIRQADGLEESLDNPRVNGPRTSDSQYAIHAPLNESGRQSPRDINRPDGSTASTSHDNAGFTADICYAKHRQHWTSKLPGKQTEPKAKANRRVTELSSEAEHNLMPSHKVTDLSPTTEPTIDLMMF